MESNDRQLILGLAERLRQAQPVAKDPQAAELIARHIAAQPDAVYLLAQAVLVQEDALHTAQAKIAELNERVAAAPAPAPGGPAGGGFRSGMFGSGMFGRNRDAGVAPAPQPQERSGGGGFLKTAAAAAAGVAGGGLLLQGLTSAFGGHEASASEADHGALQDYGGTGDDAWGGNDDQW